MWRMHNSAVHLGYCFCSNIIILCAGLRAAFDNLVGSFIDDHEGFSVEEVLAPACVQMANPQDYPKLARRWQSCADDTWHMC